MSSVSVNVHIEVLTFYARQMRLLDGNVVSVAIPSIQLGLSAG